MSESRVSSSAIARAIDWIVAAALCAIPCLGPSTSHGDAFSLAGVGVLLWTGHRAPISDAARRAVRAAGLSLIMTLAWLIVPFEGGEPLVAAGRVIMGMSVIWIIWHFGLQRSHALGFLTPLALVAIAMLFVLSWTR